MATNTFYRVKLGFDFTGSYLLFVDCFQHFCTMNHGWFREALTFSKLQQCLALLKFLFILFERFVDVFAIF